MTLTGPGGRIERHAGALMWRLHDGVNVLEGYVADCGVLGTEFRLYLNGHFSFSARYPTRQEALLELAFQHYEALNRGFSQIFPAVASTGAA